MTVSRHFSIFLSRIFLGASLCFGLLSIAQANFSHAAFLAFLLSTILFRKRYGKELFAIPDKVLVCLPYFWALSSTKGFSPFSGLFLALISILGAFNLAVFRKEILDSAKLLKCDLDIGAFIAFMSLLFFISAMSFFIKPYYENDYREISTMGILFFGGIPVSRVSLLSNRA